MTREETIITYYPLVKIIASKIQARLPKNIQLQDLISLGTIGLIKAVDNYDTVTYSNLQVYAEHKIRGAILDGLRKEDIVARPERERIKKIEKITEALSQKLMRNPTSEEIQAELPVFKRQKCNTKFRGINKAVDIAKISKESLIFKNDTSSSLEILEKEELKKLLKKGIQTLSVLQQKIIQHYYYEDLTSFQIAKILNTKSILVLSHLHRCRLKLRKYIKENYETKSMSASA